MGVDGEGRHTEGLRHDHSGSFVAHAGQSLQFLEGPRHLTSVPVQQEP